MPKLTVLALFSCIYLQAATGDPQIRTDHMWYPGELAISTFDRLFATQAALYQRVTGKPADSDERKALAAWLWRNTHYWHGEAGKRDLWGEGLGKGKDTRLREYWSGLFAYGFGLCGTTHSQWTAEFDYLLGQARGRGVGVAGHNAFEVFLKGGAYGTRGQWSLLDHDLSTVIFDDSGRRLLGLAEIHKTLGPSIDRKRKPEKQRGWLVCGLHPADGNSYKRYSVAEYHPGYAGPPPILHLRRGERLRRYFQPGLADGRSFVFWGRNYNTKGIPGPERSRTWVNQPEKMHGSQEGTAHHDGQARFANAEYIYVPDFGSGDYREALISEDDSQVTFEFVTPYIIAATPPNNDSWGIYDSGGRNGLVLRGTAKCDVRVSTNAGASWSIAKPMRDGLDLTDEVKGRAQYWLRFEASAQELRSSQLEIRTVCQLNVATLPRLRSGGCRIDYAASGKRLLSAGPEADLASSYLSQGAFGDKAITLTLPAGSSPRQIYAAAHIASGSPPNPDFRYQIDFSIDNGDSWLPMVKDWSIPRRGDEPGDFWSQSFCYGTASVPEAADTIQIRFHNDGGKRYLRAEAHLVQDAGAPDPVRVTYDWDDSAGHHQESHTFGSGPWQLSTQRDVHCNWVEFVPVPSK
ncbi:MAG: hypothetical protein ACI8W8_000327 [Rhodothermales bacterium]|jgi:hypothetical protein